MNNSIRFIDPDGNQVWDLTTDKAHKSALARFARTRQGRRFLAQYAKAGNVIGGVTFKRDGKYPPTPMETLPLYSHEQKHCIWPYPTSPSDTPARIWLFLAVA